MTARDDYNAAAGHEHHDPNEMVGRMLIAERTNYELVLDWEQSEKTQMTDDLPKYRGWLLDELQKRNPQALAAWLESSDSSPRKFFVV